MQISNLRKMNEEYTIMQYDKKYIFIENSNQDLHMTKNRLDHACKDFDK